MRFNSKEWGSRCGRLDTWPHELHPISTAKPSLKSVLSLKSALHEAHALGTFKKHALKKHAHFWISNDRL
jgi:hypothetical protein